MQSLTSKGISCRANKIGLNIGYIGIGQAPTLLTGPYLDFREKNNVDRKDFLDNMMVLRKRGQEANGAQNVASEYLNL